MVINMYKNKFHIWLNLLLVILFYFTASSQQPFINIDFKKEIGERLYRIHEGFQRLKKEGFNVDAVAPQAAIYLTVKIDLAGKKTADGTILESQADVTSYILDEAKLAIVPFSAFGASKSSPWYRLSVGTCRKENIAAMFQQLREAMEKLTSQ